MVIVSLATDGQDSTFLNGQRNPDSVVRENKLGRKSQVDLIDIGRRVIKRHAGPRKDSTAKKAGKVYAAALPSAQYTLQTGFAVTFGGNAAFFTRLFNRKCSVNNIFCIVK